MPDRSSKMFSMKLLPVSKRVQIVSMLVEGNSLLAITRMVGCSITK